MAKQNTEIAQRLEDPESAGEFFRQFLARKSRGNGSTELAGIAANPVAALVALQAGDDVLGLNARGAADILEAVLETATEGGDEQRATQMMSDNLTVDRMAELLAGRGDLTSISADLAPLPAVIEAVEVEMGDDLQDPRAYLFLRAWAMKLKDRVDYPLFLRHQTGSGATFRQMLLTALLIETGDEAFEISPDLFVQVGLDPVDEMDVFQGMIEEGSPDIDEEALSAAKAELAQRREEVEKQREENEARGAAEDVADDLDI